MKKCFTKKPENNIPSILINLDKPIESVPFLFILKFKNDPGLFFYLEKCY